MKSFADRHAAGESLGDREIKSTAGIGLNRSRLAATDDSRIVADCQRRAIGSPEDYFGALLQDPCLLQQWGQPRAPPAGVADGPDEKVQSGAVIPRTLQCKIHFSTPTSFEVSQRQALGAGDQA